ncbi:MAG: UDP-N-acetylglucosamine 2-epimerase (non-hydrolyzing) [Elainellaceae cyanobacterium]
MKILNVVGARPNFVKIAPILRQMNHYSTMQWQLVHTGQHYDDRMSQVFFDDLQLPAPDVFLGIGSGSHADQTGRAMMALEGVMQDYQPDLVVVVGDVNSTLAGALAASKLHIPIAHVEAGLRSWDRTMPEEINRICTDAISDLFFTTSAIATDNLLREGIAPEAIHFVGNVMIDSLKANLERARHQSTLLETYPVQPQQYGLVTLHRPGNVDDPVMLGRLLEAIATVSERVPLLFPMHPRTQQRLETFGLQARLDSLDQVWVTPPLGYLDFICALSSAQFTLMDSSGVQEETTALGIPCLTMRDNTDRPETVIEGTNTLVGQDPDRIIQEVFQILEGQGKTGRVPDLWDGNTAERIVDILAVWGAALPTTPPCPTVV